MGYDDMDDPWSPTGRYGKDYVNTEGEKLMAEIDWKKPLRVYPPGERNKDQKVYTFKSGKQRVVWIDDRVYPVDDEGLADATVTYAGTPAVYYGQKIVENVPEEKFFVGLKWQQDGTYVLYNDGVPSTGSDVRKAAWADRPQRNGWWVVDRPQRNGWWVVDTRQSAKPPNAIAHDPKDWTVVKAVGDRTVSTDLLTGYNAQKIVADHGGVLVRVRETPAPVDTARYIQLYRYAGSREPWKINSYGNGRQEFTWGECGLDSTTLYERCNVKVRD